MGFVLCIAKLPLMVGIDGNYSNYNYLSIELISCFMA